MIITDQSLRESVSHAQLLFPIVLLARITLIAIAAITRISFLWTIHHLQEIMGNALIAILGCQTVWHVLIAVTALLATLEMSITLTTQLALELKELASFVEPGFQTASHVSIILIAEIVTQEATILYKTIAPTQIMVNVFTVVHTCQTV